MTSRRCNEIIEIEVVDARAHADMHRHYGEERMRSGIFFAVFVMGLSALPARESIAMDREVSVVGIAKLFHAIETCNLVIRRFGQCPGNNSILDRSGNILSRGKMVVAAEAARKVYEDRARQLGIGSQDLQITTLLTSGPLDQNNCGDVSLSNVAIRFFEVINDYEIAVAP